LEAALKAGEIIWSKGLLKKGNGLCHGISGNSYALYNLYKNTGDLKWKFRAYQFIHAMNSPLVKKIVSEF